MEYLPLKDKKYYEDANKVVQGLGYLLVDINFITMKDGHKVYITIARKAGDKNIGIEDCAVVHKALLLRFKALLNTEDIYMEVSSCGTEHNIKNAAEFMLFIGYTIRLWDKGISDWVYGKIMGADNKSVTIKTTNKESKNYLFTDIVKAKFASL